MNEEEVNLLREALIMGNVKIVARDQIEEKKVIEKKIVKERRIVNLLTRIIKRDQIIQVIEETENPKKDR